VYLLCRVILGVKVGFRAHLPVCRAHGPRLVEDGAETGDLGVLGAKDWIHLFVKLLL